MQIQNRNSSHTIQFNFTSDSQRNSMMNGLVKGQILEARVGSYLSEGFFSIRFRGHTLIAKTQFSLRPGQLIEAKIQDLGPPLLLSISRRSYSEEAALDQALRNLELGKDPLNRAVLKGLIALGHSIDRHKVLTIRTLLEGLGEGLDIKNTEVIGKTLSQALFLRNQGLPVTPDVLTAYLSHPSPGILGKILKELHSLIHSLRLKKFPDSYLSILADQIQASLVKTNTLTGEELKRSLNNLGLDLEGGIATWIASGENGLPKEVDKSLKLTLLKLEMYLEKIFPNTLKNSSQNSFHSIQRRIQEALQILDSIQISNLPTPTRKIINLQIPIIFNKEPNTASLTITCQEKNHRKIDPNKFRLTLVVDLNIFGQLQIDLSITQKKAICYIYANSYEKTVFLKTNFGKLETALKNCGYTFIELASYVSQTTKSSTNKIPTIGLDFQG